jgi:ectoine hydroxylase-related dioxygenase (phytanoyl-CoA dioxygenase family)
MINVWIPICGITSLSTIALVPKSHLINENKILRSFIGGKINKKEFRVRNILSWDGEKKLRRIYVPTGSALLFTPHLIHGLALNNQENTTRVSLEYRLYKKN